jgi:hypothetical protein
MLGMTNFAPLVLIVVLCLRADWQICPFLMVYMKSFKSLFDALRNENLACHRELLKAGRSGNSLSIYNSRPFQIKPTWLG